MVQPSGSARRRAPSRRRMHSKARAGFPAATRRPFAARELQWVRRCLALLISGTSMPVRFGRLKSGRSVLIHGGIGSGTGWSDRGPGSGCGVGRGLGVGRGFGTGKCPPVPSGRGLGVGRGSGGKWPLYSLNRDVRTGRGVEGAVTTAVGVFFAFDAGFGRGTGRLLTLIVRALVVGPGRWPSFLTGFGIGIGKLAGFGSGIGSVDFVLIVSSCLHGVAPFEKAPEPKGPDSERRIGGRHRGVDLRTRDDPEPVHRSKVLDFSLGKFFHARAKAPAVR